MKIILITKRKIPNIAGAATVNATYYIIRAVGSSPDTFFLYYYISNRGEYY